MFEQIQTGGLAALQKAMSDPVSVQPPLRATRVPQYRAAVQRCRLPFTI